MKKLLIIAGGAVLMELLAMEVKVMKLPSTAGAVFGIVAALLAFAAVWERPRPDERDRMIAWRSSHIALLTVASVLIGLLIYQTVSRAVDPWTVAAVAALIIGKIIGRIVVTRRS